jgi:hypothetical protein
MSCTERTRTGYNACTAYWSSFSRPTALQNRKQRGSGSHRSDKARLLMCATLLSTASAWPEEFSKRTCRQVLARA